MVDRLEWRVQMPEAIPAEFLAAMRSGGAIGDHAAQLLWRRGIREPAGFLDADRYSPTSPFAFGTEMESAVTRVKAAWEKGERIAIWGDRDADGITATAVLWAGLGYFLAAEQLVYTIPDRVLEPRGLSVAGIDRLNCNLIITAGTGSLNADEIEYACDKGIDVIIVDDQMFSSVRPAAIALLNPQILSEEHPLAHLSSVAVAYKFIEALSETLPLSQQITDLLDIVAIGLMASGAVLQAEGRYLAQRGIVQLQRSQRPGIQKLLELCQKSGDRPTDSVVGLATRINAVSQIHGDGRFCVALLTSQDQRACRQWAEAVELANARRKALQKDGAATVRRQMAQIDLSTTRAIVIEDAPEEVLGLVAEQMVQELGRPVILLVNGVGVGRSTAAINLYALVRSQAHLLTELSGDRRAIDLKIPVENIGLFTAAMNRQLRALYPDVPPTLTADLTVTVNELGQTLFRELKRLEPYGVGNPVPRLFIQNCWFERVWHRNLEDWRGRKVRYIKTEFEIWDDRTKLGFPGVWWEHYRDEIPPGRCDAIAELDYNAARKRYEVRLIGVRPTGVLPAQIQLDWLLDWRSAPQPTAGVLQIQECPADWEELQTWFRQAVQTQQKLAIAYPPMTSTSPAQIWQTLVGIAKYLSRTGKVVTREQVSQKLGVGDRALEAGLQSLRQLGWNVEITDINLQVSGQCELDNDESVRGQFITVVQEDQFRRQYFCEVSFATIQAVAAQTVNSVITRSDC
jgi:single-stranded-DNA-specific exonuclease